LIRLKTVIDTCYLVMQDSRVMDQERKRTRSVGQVSALLVAAAFTIRLGGGVEAAEPEPTGAKVDVMELNAIPPGNYLVEIRVEGATRLANFKVEGDRLECVESTFASAVGMRGVSFPVGNGVFMVQVRNRHHAATMFWAFRPDGGAAIKEVPDRGENHTAVPVEGTTLKRPKKNKKKIRDRRQNVDFEK
jgi:hypothetical protein